MPEQEVTSEDISRLVFKDDLTGLYNRRYLYQYLSKDVEWKSEQPKTFSMIMMDLDSFKAVNDTYGHLEGDRVLKQTAEILLESFRDQDIVTRYAGDEFTVILPDTGRGTAIKLAESARHRLENKEFRHGEKEIRGSISLSAGVAVFPDDACSAEELIDKADKALYLSKASGRNTVSDTLEIKHRKEPAAKALPHKLYRGSQKQIENIVRLAGTAEEGENHFVFVKAPSEAGKTRFLGELVRQVEAVGVQCIVETCSEHERGNPYKPLAVSIDRFLSRNVSQTRRVKNALSYDELFVTAHEIPTLAKVVTDTSAAGKLSPLLQRFKLFDGLCRTLSAISQERAVCIILDEFQFVDEGTLNIIISTLKGSSGRIILCGAFQLEPGSEGEIEDPVIGKFLDEARETKKVFDAVLEPLGLKDVSALISQLLPGREESEGFDRMMCDASKGSPLYIETAIQILTSKNVIRFEENKWKISHVRREDLPDSLDTMVRDQMAMLDREAEKVISEAAVIGSNFSLEVLGRVSDVNEGHMLDMLDRAKQFGLVENTESMSDDELKFVSSQVHDATYESVDEKFRVETHGRVAEVLEDIYKDNLDQAALALAYHYQAAGNEEKAEEYLALGEEHAERIFNREQIEKHARGQTVRARIEECREELSEEEIGIVMQALQALSRTSKSLQMYPEGSQLITQAVDLLQNAIDKALERVDGFTVAESRKGMLLNGSSVDPKSAGMTASEINKDMHDRSIQSITFIRGVQNNELLSFATLFGMPPARGILEHDFWDGKMEEAGVAGIGVVQKAFVIDVQKARKTGIYKKQLHKPLSGEALLRVCTLIRRMNSTVEKMTLYPPGSSLIATAVDQVEKAAAECWSVCDGFSVSEIDGKLLINGVTPGPEMLSGGVADFPGVLQRSGAASLTLRKNVPHDEIKEFLHLLGTISEPKPISEWLPLLQEKGITHIKVGENIYAGARASTKPSAVEAEKKTPAQKPAEKSIAQKAEEICTYDPAKLLTPKVISSLPGIMEALIADRESDLLKKLANKVTDTLSLLDVKLREKGSRALLDIYHKSSAAVQEVLLLLSRDVVSSALEAEDTLEPYVNLIEYAGQVARVCAEMKDLENLNRIVRAMKKPAMAEDADREIKKTGEKAMLDLFNSADFKPLLARVESPGLENRGQLVSLLGVFGLTSAPILVSLIKKTQDSDIRRLAARALGEGGPQAVAKLSSELTRYAPEDISCRILRVLDETGEDALSIISQTVLHPNYNVRRESVTLLKKLDHETVSSMLLGIVDGSDAEASVFAINALEELGYPESARKLCELLRIPADPHGQAAACAALGKIGGQEAVEALKNVIESKRLLGLKSTFPAEVRTAAASALGNINDDTAREILQRLLKDKTPAVRSAAEQSLK